MLAIERHQYIVKLIRQNGKVTIAELMNLFHVSAETIRKDLLYLEQNRALKRTHGGAVCINHSCILRSLQERKQDRVTQKAELCRYALSFIQNGDVVAIDAGSTAIELAKLISCTFSKLTVVTHSMDVFQILSENSEIELILCGGKFIPEESAFGGYLTVDSVSQVHTAKAFLCPTGVSVKFGITDYCEPLLAVQRSYLSNTDQVFVLADSNKFETSAHLKLCDTQPDFTYITDSELPDEIYSLYSNHNIIRRSPK